MICREPRPEMAAIRNAAALARGDVA